MKSRYQALRSRWMSMTVNTAIDSLLPHATQILATGPESFKSVAGQWNLCPTGNETTKEYGSTRLAKESCFVFICVHSWFKT